MTMLGKDLLSPPTLPTTIPTTTISPTTITPTTTNGNGASLPRKRVRDESDTVCDATIGDGDATPHVSQFKHIVLDIEGTTTPISFVKDTLFPYATSHVEGYLESTWASDSTRADVTALTEQMEEDRTNNVLGVPVLPLVQGKDNNRGINNSKDNKGEEVKGLVKYVQGCIAQDRKVGREG